MTGALQGSLTASPNAPIAPYIHIEKDAAAVETLFRHTRPFNREGITVLFLRESANPVFNFPRPLNCPQAGRVTPRSCSIQGPQHAFLQFPCPGQNFERQIRRILGSANMMT